MAVNPTEDETGEEEHLDETAAAFAQQVDAACAKGEDNPTDLEAELAAEKDRLLRLRAEMQNLRNRLSREIADERRYAPLPLLRDLLPVVDNIDRAVEAAEQQGEAASLLEGFKLVRQLLVGILEQHACQPIDALGQPFDPQVHEAILKQPSDEHPADHVSLVTQQGYQLHDRVVRPSQVIVSAGPAKAEAEE
jgi:molecular chaperone GrpE